MPPSTRYQKQHPHGLVFSGEPLSDQPDESALLPGIWVYLEIPARKAHLYGMKPKDYVWNYMETFVDNTLAEDILPEVAELMRTHFRQHHTTLSATNTHQLVKPGRGQVFEQ